MKLSAIVETSTAVSGTRSRHAKRDALADCLRQLDPDEIGTACSYLCGSLPQGSIGVGPAMLKRCATVPPAESPHLHILEVDRRFSAITDVSGTGATAQKKELVQQLFADAVRTEQHFLIRLLVGELRQGALQGVMMEAISKAFLVSAGDVRRAAMLSGDIAGVAAIAATKGSTGLRQVRLRVGTPIQSMLAQPAKDTEGMFIDAESAILDLKMDGARVQAHKSGNDVAIFSRQLNDVSAGVPELVERVARLPVHSVVLDGEAITMAPDGRPLPFQTTMRRFGRRQNVAALRASLPLSVFFFDCMHAEEDIIDQPLHRRLATLDNLMGQDTLMPRTMAQDAETAELFYNRALASGHEGIMVKSPDAPYEAGSRGKAWRKLKYSHTLDLVVLGAEWGSGRRRGLLSNLHLGARDEQSGGFVMLGKTFKGLTDEILRWQTEALQKLEVSCDEYTIYVEPALVVEIAFNDVQSSSQYPGGVALRFARVKGYRPDKSPSEADTFSRVLALLPNSL